MSLEHLTDQLLIESYQQAKTLNLDPLFIELLWKEITRRNL